MKDQKEDINFTFWNKIPLTLYSIKNATAEARFLNITSRQYKGTHISLD